MDFANAVRTACIATLVSGAFLPSIAAIVTVPPGATIALPSGTVGLACADLTVQGALSLGASQVGPSGNVSIASGATVNGGSATLTVGGNWANAGTFTAGTSTVVFADGCSSAPVQITGTTSFANLTLSSNTGRTFVIPSGNLLSASGSVVLIGAVGVPLQVVSSVAGQTGNIALLPGGTLSSTNAVITSNVTIGNPIRLVNISTRMQVLTGNDVMIAGFVIGGQTSKSVAVVATGPSLAPFGIANPLANPMLTLVRSSDQAVVASVDNWQGAANASALQAAGFAPTDALEAGLLVTLAPGAYTAIVEGAGGGTGVAVAGVYEVDGAHTPLVNISTRGRVLTGNDVMIGGFVINGSGPQQVAIVATGPSLAQFGIANPLANPKLTLVRSSDQSVIGTNDDWQAHANAAALQAAGFAPTNALEAGILTTLQPGAYTAIVEGAGGGTGVAVVGVYKVN